MMLVSPQNFLEHYIIILNRTTRSRLLPIGYDFAIILVALYLSYGNDFAITVTLLSYHVAITLLLLAGCWLLANPYFC